MLVRNHPLPLLCATFTTNRFALRSLCGRRSTPAIAILISIRHHIWQISTSTIEKSPLSHLTNSPLQIRQIYFRLTNYFFLQYYKQTQIAKMEQILVHQHFNLHYKCTNCLLFWHSDWPQWSNMFLVACHRKLWDKSARQKLTASL